MHTRGFSSQFLITLRLYVRNTMALVYGYVFPSIFLITFWVLYRYDRVPLIRHMGELLTIAVLGGACFGLPTSMVSDRERGVWRRYRLTPASTLSLVVATVGARFVILLSAGLLQVALAMALGMPSPRHPMELAVAFAFVAFAFLGLGLVIAMLADNVPAVQALGQCIFLPMLVIGGIAIRLDALPEWAQHLSAFFPGRYAVAAIQSCVTGTGLLAVTPQLLSLATIGAASGLAASKMFRWDASQRFLQTTGKAWVGVALAAWLAVGIVSEIRGGVVAMVTPSSDRQTVDLKSIVAPNPTAAASSETPREDRKDTGMSASRTDTSAGRTDTSASRTDMSAGRTDMSAGRTDTSAGRTDTSAGRTDTPPPIGPSRWQDVTLETIEHDIVFSRLPPDNGVVTPIASSLQEPDADLYDQLDVIAAGLPTWAPALVNDPVQKVRNLLYVAAVPDVLQMSAEQYIPAVVFTQIEAFVPKDTLIKVLYWIAVHPEAGDDSAMSQLQPLGLGNGPNDIPEARGRAAVYAVKLLGRVTGKRPGR